MRVNVNIPFFYAAGRAGSLFLNGLKRGEILASCCPACARTLVPCRSFCPQCFRRFEETDIEPVGPGGVLVARAAGDPGVLGLIRLDGADNHFLHRVTPVSCGSRVEARFKLPGERMGHLLDIEYFEPGPKPSPRPSPFQGEGDPSPQRGEGQGEEVDTK